MKLHLLSISCLFALTGLGQGFPASGINWSLVNGGKLAGGSNYGFNGLDGSAGSSDDTGSQNWALMDMNGDKRPDLVVTAQLQGGNITSFSPGSSQYWNVYLNTGSSFAATPLPWSLPNGGRLSGGITFGFDNIAGTASSSHDTGSQTWSVNDMDGDGKPDLVVSAQLQGGNVTSFSPGAGQYWKVYLNTGSGFSSTGTNWNLPNGGKLTGGITYGYNAAGGSAVSSDDTGSQSWTLMDIDGDKKPDLIVSAQLQGGNVTSFSPGAGQYWKVYLNTGSGFSSTLSNWSLPTGGKLMSGINYGYNGSGGFASSADDTGSQTWSLADMDGDNKTDLIVVAQLQGGNVTSFSPGPGQYWKVYLNTGAGFSSAPSNWNLPNGGRLAGGITYGFNNVSSGAAIGNDPGSQSWALVDMDGYGRPELVITAQLQGGQVTSFSPSGNQYWNVYANTGTGFGNTPISCSLPLGGGLTGAGVNRGFYMTMGTAMPSDNTGSQTWAVTDMDGDNVPDLVVAAQLQAGKVTSFAPGPAQYWKVYQSNFVTGIKEQHPGLRSFQVFPNPSTGAFSIRGTRPEKVIISNEIGQCVQTLELNELNNFSAELSGLQSGIYIISGKGTQAKLVVLH